MYAPDDVRVPKRIERINIRITSCHRRLCQQYMLFFILLLNVSTFLSVYINKHVFLYSITLCGLPLFSLSIMEFHHS